MRSLAIIILGSTGLFFLANLLLRMTGVAVWDDAYFFMRFAENLLQEGSWTWNPGEEPIYGLTSLSHGVQIVLANGLGGSPAFGLWWSSMLWGLLALGIMLRWWFRYCVAGPGKTPYAAYVLVFGLAFTAPQWAEHCSSGMDTMMALAYFGGYLLLFKRWETSLSPGKAFVLGFIGSLAYVTRPELLLFSFGLPLGFLLWERNRVQRAQAGYILLFTLFFLLGQAYLLSSYFGEVLPLSFWVKSVGGYGEHFNQLYREEALMQLLRFLAANWLPLLLLVWGIWALGFKKWWSGLTALERALLVGTLVYLFYQSVFVIQVMGYAQRFYFPILPALFYLGGKSLVLLLKEKPQLLSQGPVRLNRRVVAGLLVLQLGVFGALAWQAKLPNLSRDWGRFSQVSVYHALGRHNWIGLDRWDVFPSDFVMAATEMGIPGVMHPDKEIVDLTGLLNSKLSETTAAELLLETQPDLVYAPHPDYQVMQKELRENQAFNQVYEAYSADQLKSYLGVYLRRESPYYYQCKGILEDLVAQDG